MLRNIKVLGFGFGLVFLLVWCFFFLSQSRNKDRKKETDDFLAQLEAKYGNNAKKGGKKTAAKKGKK